MSLTSDILKTLKDFMGLEDLWLYKTLPDFCIIPPSLSLFLWEKVAVFS